jgi:hypothetical protein
MNFAITVVSPPNYVHSAAFAEVAESLLIGLRELGHDAVLTDCGELPGRRHIVLGANLLPHYRMPVAEDAILYNLEQVCTGSVWIKPELLDLYRRHTLWDYSPRNAAALRTLGIDVAAILPIGYAKTLTRIKHAADPMIDVLFIGSMNPRRLAVLERMRDLGLRVQAAFGVYGAQRDALIGRARLLLNVHFYEAKVLEMVRIAYLLANRCAVLSEYGADPDEDAALEGCVAFADYDALPELAAKLVADGQARARLAQSGYDWIRARPVSAYLRTILAGSDGS